MAEEYKSEAIAEVEAKFRKLYPTGHKCCSNCGRWRPVTDFNVHKWSKGHRIHKRPLRLQARCKTCNRISAKERARIRRARHRLHEQAQWDPAQDNHVENSARPADTVCYDIPDKPTKRTESGGEPLTHTQQANEQSESPTEAGLPQSQSTSSPSSTDKSPSSSESATTPAQPSGGSVAGSAGSGSDSSDTSTSTGPTPTDEQESAAPSDVRDYLPVGPFAEWLEDYLATETDNLASLCQRAGTSPRAVKRYEISGATTIKLQIVEAIGVAAEHPQLVEELYG